MLQIETKKYTQMYPTNIIKAKGRLNRWMFGSLSYKLGNLINSFLCLYYF